MGSKRERPEGSGHWELRVYAGREGGRDIYATDTFEGDARAAVKALAKFESELEDDRAPAPGQGTVEALLELWWSMQNWKTAGSRKQARGDMDRYLIPHLGKTHLARLKHDPIDDLYQGLLAGRLSKSERPLKKSTVQRVHGTLHAALEWGVMKGKLGRNPAARATSPGAQSSEIVPPEWSEVRLLVARAGSGFTAGELADTEAKPGARAGQRGVVPADPAFAFFLYLAAGTGRRRGDLLALQVADFHFDTSNVNFSRRAVLDQDASGGVTIEAFDKNGRAVRLEVDDGVMAHARRHITALKEDALALGVACGKRSFLFSHDGGRSPWRPDSTTRRFGKLARRCGLEDLDLHGLRHFHITELLTAGVDIETVAHRVGDDPRTIYKFYSHFRPAADRRAAQVWATLSAENHTEAVAPVVRIK